MRSSPRSCDGAADQRWLLLSACLVASRATHLPRARGIVGDKANPLGATYGGSGTNFALFREAAETVGSLNQGRRHAAGARPAIIEHLKSLSINAIELMPVNHCANDSTFIDKGTAPRPFVGASLGVSIADARVNRI